MLSDSRLLFWGHPVLYMDCYHISLPYMCNSLPENLIVQQIRSICSLIFQPYNGLGLAELCYLCAMKIRLISSVAHPKILKCGRSQGSVSAPLSFIANAHNKLYAFYTGKYGLLKENNETAIGGCHHRHHCHCGASHLVIFR